MRCCSSTHQKRIINDNTLHFINVYTKFPLLKMHLTSVKDGICSELLGTSNSINRQTSTMQSEDCPCLQDYQAKDNASAPSKNVTEYLVLNDDGDFNKKLSSFNSGSTSGVFSSSNSSNESCKHDSSNIKVCLSLEELHAQSGNIKDASANEGSMNEVQKLPLAHAVTSHPCCVAEATENCYEVTIHRTVVSPRMSYNSMEGSNAERKKALVAVNGSSSELHISEKSVFNEQSGCLLGRDEKSENGGQADSPFTEIELTELELCDVSIDDQHSFEVAEPDKELQSTEFYKYFDMERRNLCGLYQSNDTEIQVARYEVESDITSKTKSNAPGGLERVQQLDYTSREEFKVNIPPMYPMVLQNDDELEIEEKEYVEVREVSCYSKYIHGPFTCHPMPLDNFLEEGADFQIHHVHWAFPSVANEYYGDNFTAVVPFANKMREEDHERYPKQKSTLKEKLQSKLQKLKKFFGRTSRRVESASDDEHFHNGELNQELFLLQIQGSWNLCYETEAIEELSNTKMSAIVSLGKYRPPSFDDVRKVIAKNPSLCTIVEEGEEIRTDEASEVDYANDH